MILVGIVLIWAVSVIYVWQMHAQFIDDKFSWWQTIELIFAVLLFGPAIAFSLIGLEIIQLIFYQNNLDIYAEEEKNLKIAIVQFGEIKDLVDSRFTAMVERHKIDWYYFDETADREFEINDLKEHYDILLEVLDNEKNTQIRVAN